MSDHAVRRLFAGETEAEAVRTEEGRVALEGRPPGTPARALAMLRASVVSASGIEGFDYDGAGRRLPAAAGIASAAGTEESDYRLTGNSGLETGQLVAHQQRHGSGGRRRGREA